MAINKIKLYTSRGQTITLTRDMGESKIKCTEHNYITYQDEIKQAKEILRKQS